MQRAPLAHDFAVGARINDLIDGDAGALIAGDVANAVAAGLDAVHVNRGQQVHHVSACAEWYPVELDVLPGGEVAVAGWQIGCAELGLAALCRLVNGRAGLVVFARNLRQHAQLAAGEFAVGNGHAQHRRVTLHVPAVLQPQRAKVIIAERAGLVALKLVAVLRGALRYKLSVKSGVLVHVFWGRVKGSAPERVALSGGPS